MQNMGIFGPSKNEIWKEIADELGGRFIDGKLFKDARIEIEYKNFIIYLDTYTVSTGNSHITYSRMRVPFINLKNFRFKIYREDLFSNIGKAFGMQDIEIGDEEFDKEFVIKGNDEGAVKKILLNSLIRELIANQSRISLEVTNHEGAFGPKFVEGESEIIFHIAGVIKDTDKIKSLIELYKNMLNEFENDNITINQRPQTILYK